MFKQFNFAVHENKENQIENWVFSVIFCLHFAWLDKYNLYAWPIYSVTGYKDIGNKICIYSYKYGETENIS